MSTNYQKIDNIPMPTQNFEFELEKWFLEQADQAQLDRYIAVRDLHESLVAIADERGERNTIWHEHGDESYWEIQWVSPEVHRFYMDQISHEEHDFYMLVRNKFYEYLAAKKGLSAP